MEGWFDYLTDRELAARLTAMYNEVIRLRKDEDFAVNQPQMDKFLAVIRFYLDMSEYLNGSIDEVSLVPTKEHGGVTATFQVFDLYGDQVQKFCEVMSGCSAISIDIAEDDKVCISCTVPNVFISKSETE